MLLRYSPGDASKYATYSIGYCSAGVLVHWKAPAIIGSSNIAQLLQLPQDQTAMTGQVDI